MNIIYRTIVTKYELREATMSNSKEVNSRHSFLKVGVDMIKENQKMLIRLHVLMDACTIIVAYLFAYYI
jgi:hypothetical protein